MNNRTPREYIWSREQMLAFLKHKSENVSSWAAEHITKLYPDLVDQVVEFLPMANSKLASTILSGLAASEVKTSKLKAVLDIIQNADDDERKFNAVAVLHRSGYVFSESEMSNLPVESMDFLVSSEAGFRLVLKKTLTLTYPEIDELYCVALGCGCNEFNDLLGDCVTTKDKLKTIKFLADSLQINLPGKEMVFGIQSSLKLLKAKLQEYSERAAGAVNRFPGLTQQIDRESACCRLLADAVQECLDQGRELDPEFSTLLSACVIGMSQKIQLRHVLGEKDLDVGLFYSTLARHQWKADVDEGVIEFLRSQDPEVAISTLRKSFDKQKDDVFAVYTFRCLEAAAIPGRYELFLDALNGQWKPNITSEVEDFIEAVQPDIVEAAMQRWQKKLPETIPFWLNSYPVQKVVQHLVDNFDYYFETGDPRFFEGLLEDIGSLLFFEPLVNVWRPGESAMAASIKTIAELNGISDQRMVPILKDIEPIPESLHHINDEEGLRRFILESELLLPLKCKVCHRTYHYPVENLYLEKSKAKYHIGDIIQCKNCGSLENYEETDASTLLISMHMEAFMDLEKEGLADIDNMPVKGVVNGFSAGGRQFRSPIEAFQYIQKEAAAHPDDPEWRNRLAKTLDNGNRSDLALPHFLEVLKQRPDDLEVLLYVAQIYVKLKNILNAVPYIEKTVLMVRQNKMDENMRRNAFIFLVNILKSAYEDFGYQHKTVAIAAFLEESGESDIDLSDEDYYEPLYRRFMGIEDRPDEINSGILPAPQNMEQVRILQHNRIGRNDPCPCGSGKKYKKCCGKDLY